MSALRLFAPLKGYLSDPIDNTESSIFQLSYKGTVIMLIASCSLLTMSEVIGSTILCDSSMPKAVETFCWIHSTFTMPDFLNREKAEKSNER